MFKEDNRSDSPLTKTLERMNTPEETPVRIYSPTTPKKKRSVRRTTLSKKKKQRGKREESPDEK